MDVITYPCLKFKYCMQQINHRLHRLSGVIANNIFPMGRVNILWILYPHAHMIDNTHLFRNKVKPADSGNIHYSDITMSTMASQITGVVIVYSTDCWGTDQRKHQSSASLDFVRGIHRWPVNSPHKGPVTWKIFPLDDIIMLIAKILCWLVMSIKASPVSQHTLQWRHNDQDSVSNHQPHGCLLSCLYRRRSKKTSKLRVTGLCVGNSPGPVNSPHKGPVTQKMFPFDDVIMSPK